MIIEKISKNIIDFNENSISFKVRINNSKIWEDVFNELKYKSVMCSNTFVQYQYIYNLSFEKKLYDFSIILFFKDKPIGLLPMFYFPSKNSLSYFNGNILTPSFVSNISDSVKNEIFIFILNYILKLKNLFELKNIQFCFIDPFDKSSLYSSLDKKFNLLENYDLYLDLSLSLEKIKKEIRKSYINIIHKKKNILISVLSNNEDKNIWSDFKNLHLEVSKKKTRSDDSWDEQFKNLCKKRSYFFYLYENNQLVAGSLFDITKDEAYYSVGAYSENAKKNNISHLIQYSAINFFKAKKIKWYYLGKYTSNLNNYNNKKDFSISFFKKGFSSLIVKNSILEI